MSGLELVEDHGVEDKVVLGEGELPFFRVVDCVFALILQFLHHCMQLINAESTLEYSHLFNEVDFTLSLKVRS